MVNPRSPQSKNIEDLHKLVRGWEKGFGEKGVTNGVSGRFFPKEHPSEAGIQPYIDQVSLLDQQEYLEILRDDEFFNPSRLLNKVFLPDFKIQNWGLPGKGFEGKNCGTVFWKGCLNISEHPEGLGFFEPRACRCFSPTCPTCWSYWCKREAGRIAHRIKSYIKNFPHLKAIHVTASVPKCDYHRSISDLRRMAQHRVKISGFWGGSCILHLYRQHDKLWYFSPHFHFIGVGWMIGVRIARLFKKDGWIVKNIGIRKTIFGTAFYQLTHCAVWYGEGRKHSVTWFGCMSYSKFSSVKIEPKPHGCPYCAGEIESLVWVGEGDPPLPCGGGYLALAEGWASRMNEYWSNFLPVDLDWRSAVGFVPYLKLDLF